VGRRGTFRRTAGDARPKNVLSARPERRRASMTTGVEP
jgi:hypothetical protein